jgi:hypothetical protein
MEVVMAEIREVREVREVPAPVIVHRSSPGSLLLMFLLGLICAAAIAWGIANAIGVTASSHPLRVSWPSGQVQLSQAQSPYVIYKRGQS